MTNSFILDLNIERYRHLLADERNETKRNVLEKLLVEAEAELDRSQRATADK